MKPSPCRSDQAPTAARFREHAGVRIVLLVSAAFLLGLASGAFWLYHASRPEAAAPTEAVAGAVLSDATKLVLQKLPSPVTIRFYALLDPASVPAALQEFAGRVDLVLAEYERESKGKLQVIRSQGPSDMAANAAAADKLKAFNLDKGDACYLGLTVACKDRHETLPELLPEWEPAFESDLTRALARVIAAPAQGGQPVEPTAPNLKAIEEVKRALPDLASVSLEEGTRRLREKARATFATTAQEMDVRVKQAQQRVQEAQQNGDETTIQATLKALQSVQAEQMDKLKQVAAQVQAQVAALEQLKKQ